MRVSVVMAGRNSNPALLKEAIDSVLNQTFQDFEFVFVDDGSDTPMEPVVRSISKDERIIVYRIDPSGLGAALNYGVSQSHGDLIARIDDDDISLPSRFEKQVSFMDKHPEVSCIGAQMYFKYKNKIYPHTPFPLDHDGIIRQFANLHFSLGHTASMFRRSCFDKIGGYRIPGGGQDLDLFLQMGTVGKLHNLGDYLVLYTLSPAGLSVNNPKKTDAYQFALEAALKYEGYSAFIDDFKKSIVNLNKSNKKLISHRIGVMKKNLLIWKVLLFGKSIGTVYKIYE